MSVIARPFNYLRTFNTLDAFKKLYYELKNRGYMEMLDNDDEWEDKLIWDGMDIELFRSRRPIIDNVKQVLELEPEEFLYECYKEKFLQKLDFPYNLVNRDDKVILYGAGVVGRAYFWQNYEFDYCKIVGWVDREYIQKGFPVGNPDEIVNIEFDKIIIAIENEDVVNVVKVYLIELGVDVDKILWQNPYRE